MASYLMSMIVTAVIGGAVGSYVSASHEPPAASAAAVAPAEAAAPNYQAVWDDLSYAMSEHWGRFRACHRDDLDYDQQAARIEAAHWEARKLGIKARVFGVIGEGSAEEQTRTFRAGQAALAEPCDRVRQEALAGKIETLRAMLQDNPLLNGKALHDAEAMLKALNGSSAGG